MLVVVLNIHISPSPYEKAADNPPIFPKGVFTPHTQHPQGRTRGSSTHRSACRCTCTRIVDSVPEVRCGHDEDRRGVVVRAATGDAGR